MGGKGEWDWGRVPRVGARVEEDLGTGSIWRVPLK